MDLTQSEGRSLGSGRVVVRGRAIQGAPVRSVLRSFGRPRLAWVDGSATIAGGGTAAAVTATGRDRFETVREKAARTFDGIELVDSVPESARPRFYGGFAFTGRHDDPGAGGTWYGYPAARFSLPAVQLCLTADGAWLTAAGTGPEAEASATTRLRRWQERIRSLPALGVGTPPGVRGQTYDPSRAQWREQVETAVSRIRHGDLRKVVLAQSLSVALAGPASVPDVLARLRAVYPDCYRFLFDPAIGGSFFGAPPERLVSLRGGAVETEALAGSIGRGETAAEDDWLEAQLEESEKNGHEHGLVVEAIRDQLAGVTDEVGAGPRTVRKLANVQHLQTPLRASFRRDAHVLDLVEALHPTPAVGGLPPGKALDTIRETEAFDRGWYAAPVGWFDANGNGTFAVAIRSAVTAGTDATLFAGAGIVRDSDPDAEWDELQLKYRPVLDELV